MDAVCFKNYLASTEEGEIRDYLSERGIYDDRDVLLRLRSWMQARQRGTGGMSEQEMFQIAKFELLAGK